MQQETPSGEKGAAERERQRTGSAEAEPREKSENQGQVATRLSVEEHLAGLWKVLGLGD